MNKHAYTVNEAMKEIGIGRTKLYGEINDGKLKARKINKRTIILADDLKAYLQSLPEYQA